MKELLKSRALQIYGALLALTHVLSAYFWMDRSLDLVVRSAEKSASLCWPLLPSCESLRFISTATASTYLQVYAGLGLITAVLFLLKKIKPAYLLLLALLGMKIYFTSLSYGLMGNYHYMSFFVQVAFLFLPHKTTVIPFFVGVFYWGAGILKLDPEWLSGVSLIHPSFLPPPLQHASLIYAVILECILVVGLFSRRAWIRHVTLAQFVLFHAFSWHIVGYFYPMTMLLLLGIFVLIPWYKESWQALWDENLQNKKSAVIFTVTLALLQILPVILVKDSAASGAPRLMSLNMLDARMECDTLLIRHQERASEVYNPFVKAPSTRTQCDPLVFLSQIESLCQNSGENFDFWMQSRRTTQLLMQTRLILRDVCKKSRAELMWAEVL
ncbi:hypothetical protein ACNH6C_08870 [Bdellovibrio bacteriovorus]|uniref:hypothetical protein n=1 Tax=Bdellovibrio bacteriovorus TaxID=959 RepID=UPI003A8047D8